MEGKKRQDGLVEINVKETKSLIFWQIK
jgi:hypothetical protein